MKTNPPSPRLRRIKKIIMKSLLTQILVLTFVSSFIFQSCKKEEQTEEPCNQPVSVDLGIDQIIHEGDSLSLDAGNSGATFLWNTGATSQSIVVSETGDYSVTVTSCSHTASDTIHIELSYPVVAVSTDFGNFKIWLYHQTPQHRANFLSLTGDNFYDSLIFHRVVQNFVIQGGDPDGTGLGGPGYTIPAEIIPGLNHVYGAVGAARLDDNVNPDKESNGSQFYIVCDPNGEAGLNGNYTVFGIVFTGLETVMAISQVEVDANQRPLSDVVMNSVSIAYYTTGQLMDDFGFEAPLP